MSQIIKLSQKDLIRIIENVLIEKPKHFDDKTNLLEFAKRLYIWDYKQNGNDLSEIDQKNFFEHLVIKNKRIINEYNSKFNNPLILESKKGADYIVEFFDFLKENTIPLDEQTKPVPKPVAKPTTPSNIGVIMKNLHQAFDGAGTNEVLAVKTILSIKTKDDLVKIDQQIKNTIGKKYPKIQTLAAWINDEMSEIDPAQYDKIWGHLTKMGYKGKESNKFLRAVGSTKEMIQKGWDWAKQGIIGKFFNGLRDALNSGWGIASQLLLDALGPFTLGISAGLVVIVWALLFLWDMFNLISGSPEWLNLIFDAFGLFTAGAMSKLLSSVKVAAPPIKSIGDFFKWIGTTKFGSYFSKWVPTIQGSISTVTGAIGKAANWITTKFAKLIGPKMADGISSVATKAKAWLTDFANKIGQWFGEKSKQAVATAVTKNVQGGLGEKIVEKLGTFIGTPKFLQTEIGLKLIEKGFKPATQEVVNKYAIELSKEKGIEFTANAVDKKYGKLYGDILRLGAAGEDTLGNKDKLLANIGEFDKSDVSKFMKTSKELAKSTKKTAGSIGQANTQKNAIVGNVKNIRPGGPKDNKQYKKVGNQYFYAGKNEDSPNWKPINSQNAINYVAKYIFSEPKGKDISLPQQAGYTRNLV